MVKSKVKDFLAALARGRNPFEVMAGAAIILVALGFLAWGVSSARTRVSGQTLMTSFSRAGGLARGADVSVRGVKIGQVAELRLNPGDYSVDVVMSVDGRYKIPADSTARIMSGGLFGGKYVDISIGSGARAADGSARLKSAEYKSLEEIIGDVIFKD
ncbi:MAG: MlaD family protein [Rickettsiales bacterium]|jgi:phospholipid/cholesterol/gamma-HCH transport system substrate-binding protein|nr:MlaD family protein [Rickettsiales bacterium]